MSLDPLAQQIGVGGIFAVVVITLVMKMLPAVLGAVKNRNGGNGPGKRGKALAGDLDPEVWEAKITALMHKENETQMADIRRMMETRKIEIREIVRDELSKWKPPA